MVLIILLPRAQFVRSKLGFSILFSSNRSSWALKSRTSVATYSQTEVFVKYFIQLLLSECFRELFTVTLSFRLKMKCKTYSSNGDYCLSVLTRPSTHKNFTTLYSVIYSTIGKYCLVAFIWMVTLWDFPDRLKSCSHIVQHNKQYHRKVLRSSFHLNGHTLRISATPIFMPEEFWVIVEEGVFFTAPSPSSSFSMTKLRALGRVFDG